MSASMCEICGVDFPAYGLSICQKCEKELRADAVELGQLPPSLGEVRLEKEAEGTRQ